MLVCSVAKLCQTLVTPWTVALQAPLSMGFFRQKYWSGLPFPSPGDLPNPGTEFTSPASLPLADTFFSHVQVNIQPKTGGPLCRLLSFLAVLWYSGYLSLSESSPLPPPLSEMPGSQVSFPDTQSGRCLSVGTTVGLASLVPHPSRIIALHCVCPVSGNNCFIAFVWLLHHGR